MTTVRSPFADRAATAAEIVAEIQAGATGEESFRRLLALYYQPVYSFFAKRGFPHEDCLDLTQETFLGIYTGIRSFRREAGFDTWLFKIATNAFRKRRRWRSAEKRAGEEVPLLTGAEEEPAGVVPVSPLPEPVEEALGRERSRLLHGAIETLPDQMRKCLALRVYRDLKYREIGIVMRLSTETVKAHLFQARRKLQEILGDYFDAALPSADEGGP
jgi:RNA polymerase sigma-70 factor (ECF subfamily)